jgi:hypothetical protein
MSLSAIIRRVIPMATVAVAALVVVPARASAHCDGIDGPVVSAARRALEARNPALALIWVQPGDERELRAAFDRTLAVRALGAEARELADRFFFETVVRLHRAGEGASFTGLQPAGRDLGPAIPAADEAVHAGSMQALRELLAAALTDRLRARFREVMAARKFDPDDVAGGRAYVKAYVELIHFVERVYEATGSAPHSHAGRAEPR